MNSHQSAQCGFTLIELLTALLILSILALASYRGLGAVLDARTHVAVETEKWRNVAAFFSRFEHDLQLAMPRAARTVSGDVPAWIGRPGRPEVPSIEFSRASSVAGVEGMRRTGYRLSPNGEMELWLWPGPDPTNDPVPERYVLLQDVAELDIQYLTAEAAWLDAWVVARGGSPLPRAVRLRLVLTSKEEIVRVFGLKS